MNQDYTERVGYRLNELAWEPSPAAGVWRKKLERQAEESGRATSLVRYDPGSSFRTHTHDGGEEILVLEGTFSDEGGDYPAGSYFRNPPGTSHAPSSDAGCVLFVKLCHFSPDDTAQFATSLCNKNWQTETPTCQLLHEHEGEETALVTLAANEVVTGQAGVPGREIFVIEGAITAANEVYPSYSWLRLPADDGVTVSAAGDGALLLIKRGHFPATETK